MNTASDRRRPIWLNLVVVCRHMSILLDFCLLACFVVKERRTMVLLSKTANDVDNDGRCFVPEYRVEDRQTDFFLA